MVDTVMLFLVFGMAVATLIKVNLRYRKKLKGLTLEQRKEFLAQEQLEMSIW